MADYVVLDVDRLTAIPTAADSSIEEVKATCKAFQTSQSISEHVVLVPPKDEPWVEDPSLPLLSGDGSVSGTDKSLVECRICQEEDEVGNLESPCACSGSVKYAHRKCVQRWCNEKGDTTCEICQQPYKNGYTAPPKPPQTDDLQVEINDEWGITGAHQLDLRDPRILAMAAERHFLESDYNEYAAANASGAACCRSAALILMALLLLRHALAMAAAGADEDTSTFFTLFVLRAAGFLLPCYIMLRALNILQRRRQRQEAALAAAEVAILIQAGQARGSRFPLSPAAQTQEVPVGTS